MGAAQCSTCQTSVSLLPIPLRGFITAADKNALLRDNGAFVPLEQQISPAESQVLRRKRNQREDNDSVCTACIKQAPRNFDRLIVWYGNGLWWVYDGDPSASCPRDILTSVYVAGDATWPLPHFKNIFTIAVQEYMSSRLKGNSLLALSQWMSNLWMWLFSIFPSPEAHSGGRILITTNTIWYGKSNFFFLVKTIFTSGNAMSPFEYQ